MNAPQPTEPTVSPKKLLLGGDPDLSAGLQASFRQILAYARMQAGLVAEKPKTSVHEFRKSIRRARALLKLLRGLIDPERYAPLAEELRASVKETSILRDVDVLTGHAEALPDVPGERKVKAALLAHLRDRQRHQAANAAVAILNHAAARVEPLPVGLAEALPSKLGPRTLHDALENTYGRARRAFDASIGDPHDAVAVHSFRKRVKELRYSLELLRERSRSPEPLERLGLLAEELGALTDINILREYVRDHREELGECGPEPLLERLDGEFTRGAGELLQRIAYVLAAEPRGFSEALLGPRPKKKKKRGRR